MKNFQNKTIAITGAGSGIGRALAIEFAGMGAKLALNDYDEEGLGETVKLLGLGRERMLEAVFDVSDRASMYGFAEDVIAKFGSVDVMINNAGTALTPTPFAEIDLENFDRLLAINFGGALNGSHAFLPHLLQRPESALVNVASVMSFSGIKRSSAYVSSKFAVYGLNQCLIQEAKGTSLRVHSVHPAGVRTNIVKNSLEYHESFEELAKRLYKLSPEDVAQRIIKGIRRKKTRILIGRDAYLMDLALRLSPTLGATFVNRILQKTRDAMDEMKRKMEANGGI